jgi:hypothetical protein
MVHSNQESLEVWVFGSQGEAVENAAFLAGYRSDLYRTMAAQSIFSESTWKVGYDFPKNDQGEVLRIFEIESPNGSRVHSFAVEPYNEGFCLWVLDEIESGVVHILGHTMEDMDGWDDRNVVVPPHPVYFDKASVN